MSNVTRKTIDSEQSMVETEHEPIRYLKPYDNSLDDLPDCTKTLLRDIDPTRRTLRCKIIEILNYDEEVSFTDAEEEEISLTFSTRDVTSDEDRTRYFLHDVDCILQRIELMQINIQKKKQEQLELKEQHKKRKNEHLKRIAARKEREQHLTKSYCYESKLQLQQEEKKTSVKKTSLDLLDKPLSDVEELEMRDLIKRNHLLLCQIKEMLLRYRNLRDVLGVIHTKIEEEALKKRSLIEMAKEYKILGEQAMKDSNKCTERYNHLIKRKKSKAAAPVLNYAAAQRTLKRGRMYLPRRLFKMQLQEFNIHCEALVDSIGKLRQEIDGRFKYYELDYANVSRFDVRDSNDRHYSIIDRARYRNTVTVAPSIYKLPVAYEALPKEVAPNFERLLTISPTIGVSAKF